MRNKFSSPIVFVVALAIGICLPATTVLAFGWSAHAKIADFENCYLCSYYSKLGSVVPDLAWWLVSAGKIDSNTASCIHNNAFSEGAPERVTLWNFRRLFFLKGAYSHFPCGDDIANMYIPFWIEAFQNRFNGAGPSILEGFTAEEIALVLELVFEYAMDARVVDAFGFQINDLLFLNWAARFVENKVEDGCFDSQYPGFDVSWEYRKFMRVLWLLEKFAQKYALLLKGEIDEWAVHTSDELQELAFELYDGGFWQYLTVLEILLEYPEEINAIMEWTENGDRVENSNVITGLSWYELLEIAETICKPTW